MNNNLLDQALASHTCWPLPPASPEVRASLSQGQSNSSFLIQYGEQPLILRLNQHIQDTLQSPRWIEVQAHRQATKAGLSPQLIYVDPAYRWQVTLFIEASQQLPLTSSGLHKLASLLQQLHQLPAVDFNINLSEVTTYYLYQIEKQRPQWLDSLQPINDIMAPLVTDLTADTGRCTCHNDLNPTNILATSDGVWVLDWEYVGMNHPYFDLAGVIQGYQLNMEQVGQLLGGYRKNFDDADLKLLKGYIAVYGYCSLLWYAVQSAATENPNVIACYQQALKQMPGLIKQAHSEQRHD